jgi:uncharacterized protein
MRILRAAGRTAVPWKNGGGVTREVAAWPEGAGFDDFLWRVSMAEVAADGPFSVFPGVDRILAVLEGRLRLEVDAQPPRELGPGDAAAFPGDAPTYGVVLQGPVLDLNVMSRRSRIEARLERTALSAAFRSPDGPSLAVATAPARLSTGEVLDPYDGLLLDRGEVVSLKALQPGVLWAARFHTRFRKESAT